MVTLLTLNRHHLDSTLPGRRHWNEAALCLHGYGWITKFRSWRVMRVTHVRTLLTDGFKLARRNGGGLTIW